MGRRAGRWLALAVLAPLALASLSMACAVGGSNTLRNLDAADTFCQGIASARGLKNTFRAWMSDSGQYPANGARFTQTARPYELMNGTIVASSFGGLMSGTLLAAISVDETGAQALGMAWTGTRVDGQRAPNANCTGWSDGNFMMSAAAGLVTATDMTWTEGSLSCASTAHLYCFEQ